MRSTDAQPQTPLERALGLEITQEAKRRNLTHRALQERTGINDKSFRRWFVAGDRHIPLDEADKVALELGLPLSVLMARAEDGIALLAEAETLRGATEAEKEDLRRAIDRARPRRIHKILKESETGS